MANLTNIRKWTAALRSGEYQQAKYVLNDGEGYCCLGVACEVAIKDDVPVPTKFHEEAPYYKPSTGTYVSYDGFGTFLPPNVKTWLGLNAAQPSVLYKDANGRERWWSVTNLNDDGGFSFSDIADLVERTAERFPNWVGQPINDEAAYRDHEDLESFIESSQKEEVYV